MEGWHGMRFTVKVTGILLAVIVGIDLDVRKEVYDWRKD